MDVDYGYDFDVFKAACQRKKQVRVTKDALEDADMTFNLKTDVEVLEFIGNDGLEDRILINRKPWANNPNPKVKIMVDAYRFKNGGTPGYIAFFYNPSTKYWIIKSFKLDRTSNFPFQEAFSALDICDFPKRLKGDKDDKTNKE